MAEFKAGAAASFSIDDLEQLSADGEETPDLLIIESGNEKFRDSSDADIDDKIRTYEGHLQDTKLLLKNKGKLQQHLEDLRTEQKFRMNRQSRLVRLFFPMPHCALKKRISLVLFWAASLTPQLSCIRVCLQLWHRKGIQRPCGNLYCPKGSVHLRKEFGLQSRYTSRLLRHYLTLLQAD
jgi:hypothetical protein